MNNTLEEAQKLTSEIVNMVKDEVKDEVLSIIKNLRRTTNQWSSRDTLKCFTSYGFWSGSEMASIDIKIANEIADELYSYVNNFSPGHPNIEEVYDDLYKH